MKRRFMDKFTLGIDIGIASVGWAVVSNDTKEIQESGVRLFSSAEASQNADRRGFRGTRRNTRRKQERLKMLESFLESKLVKRPEALSNEPLQLRVRGLEQELSKEEIFAVLYNIAKHRGVSYLEDVEEMKENDRVLENARKSGMEYPCLIQHERLMRFGGYRGTQIHDEETFINTFTIGMYENEVRKLLDVQKQFHTVITESFIEEYLEILKKKREYYIGPGNELSRTNYGVYKTSGETKDNLFDELRGKCSVYNGKNGMESELRASSASYTVQHYNLLNDLCNIKVLGNKLTQEQKAEVIEMIKLNKTAMKITAALKKLYKISPEDVSGYRKDKNNKEENHSFEVYRSMRKAFEEEGLDIANFSIEQLDAVADILTINTETEGILKYIRNEKRSEYEYVKNLTEKEISTFIELRRKKGVLFSRWSNFSYKLIKRITPEMMETGDEQHTCIQKMNLSRYEKVEASKIDFNELIDEIYNPVVSRSIIQTVKIINALIKRYEFEDIVIEMPRDRNSDEEKQNIKKIQKNNEDMKKKALQYAGITEGDLDYRNDKKILQKLKLLYKQQGRCMYSGTTISVPLLLKEPHNFEIDHIIPISISFDDSQANKVLVKAEQNRKKSNKTPFKYLQSATGVWSYSAYKAYVLELKKKGFIGEKQKELLLNEQDITKVEIVQNFVNRNINDTRYASRVVLNGLQRFFWNNNLDTKVKVINGTMTSQLRKNTLDYDKDRNLDYRHHAQDAMICCYAVLSLNKYSEEFVNIQTGEIISREDLLKLEKDEKAEYLSYSGWDIKKKILEYNQRIKFSHKIDTKVNRGVSKSTIYGTREVEGDRFVVNTICDIYDDKEYEKFQKKCKKDPTMFLMYQHDPKTWDKMMKVIATYKDVKGSPFKKYREEFGEFTKYSKKDNGPAIKALKYLDHKVGKNIDITHRYKDSKNMVILEDKSKFRADVYYDTKKECYNMVPIEFADFKFVKGKYILPIERYEKLLEIEKILKEGQTITDLEGNCQEFCFSLYKNSIIELGDKEEIRMYRFLSKNHNTKNYFEVKGIDAEFSKQTYVGLTKKIKICNKYNVDILGNLYKVEVEDLKLEFSLDNKMI